MKNFYINGLQIHSNTQDLGFVVNQNYQGLDFPNVRLASYEKPGAHGAVVSNQLYGGRDIMLPGRISGTTVAQYRQNRRLFQNIARIIKDIKAVSTPVLLQFTTMDDLSLQAYCYVKDQIPMPDSSLNHGTYILHLFAPDPNLYTQSLNTLSMTPPTAAGVVYPVIYPVIYPAVTGGQVIANNVGDANTPFVATFNGPLTSPFITNLTTGETFTLNLTLNTGDQVIVDMGANTITINGISSGLQYFVDTNVWMQLIPGNNTIQLGTGMSSDTGNVIISFRSAYLGV